MLLSSGTLYQVNASLLLSYMSHDWSTADMKVPMHHKALVSESWSNQSTLRKVMHWPPMDQAKSEPNINMPDTD